ncbi:MAG: hypothetical protein ABJZ55_11750 [Fuerstiella sp.]
MRNSRNIIRLAGVVSLLAYLAISVLSQRFGAETELIGRPILVVLSLFAVAFVCYCVAARFVFQTETSYNWREMFLWGLVFRAVLWPSLPIQEVDLYRYVWDGAVSRAGVDPYQFSPQQVVSAARGPVSAVRDPDLLTLVNMYQDRDGLRQIADKVHFAFLTTPYPPVSQAVFSFAHIFCATDASEHAFTLTFKAVVLLFDIATALVLVAMLRFLGYSQSVALLYWWCPLVIKEFANSGHLDSIAVFFVTASFFFLLRACFYSVSAQAKLEDSDAAPPRSPFGNSLASAVLLAFGVGAKLFPLVLAPLWAVTLFRRKKCEWRLPVVAFAATAAVVCWPMFARTEFVKSYLEGAAIGEGSAVDTRALQPQADTPSGIEAFYRYWEINDLLFLFLVENLKPESQVEGQPAVWFVITSDTWRASTHKTWHKRLGIAKNEVAFVLTRRGLVGVYLIVVAGVCFFVFRSPTPQNILTGGFLTIAWLWFLGPAQNPWYWTWAIPFLPFVRNRVWIAVSGLSFLYYLRFWFEGHFAEDTVLWTSYTGVAFFDFIVPWIEFGPWFLVLLIAWIRGRRFKKLGNRIGEQA